jgi:hypothetical protein
MSAAHLIGREELMAFLDGEVAPARAAIVRGHVEGCTECAGATDDWRALSQSLQEWRVEPAPNSLAAPRALGAAPLSSVLRSSSTQPRLVRTALRVLPWGVAAALVLVLVGLVALPPVNRRFTYPDPYSAPALAPPAGARAIPRSEARQQAAANDVFGGIQVVTGGGDVPAPRAAPPPPPMGLAAKEAQPVDARMVVRTATLGLSTDQFDALLKHLQTVAAKYGGTVSAYQVSGSVEFGRALSVTVRIPVAATDPALADLRGLGTVTGESQATEEITDAHRDLAIRIDNAKREAARLNELLTRQSDRLSDVLQVEQAQARVQTEIEQMTAQEAAMRGRAALSTIEVSVSEVRRAQLALGPLPVGTRIRNALVDGIRGAADSGLTAFIGLLTLGPGFVLFLAVVLAPVAVAWWAVRVFRARRATR